MRLQHGILEACGGSAVLNLPRLQARTLLCMGATFVQRTPPCCRDVQPFVEMQQLNHVVGTSRS